MNISLSPFAPENLASRDGFGSPVPRQPAHLHTQAESGACGIPPEFCGGVHLFILNRNTPSGQSGVYWFTQLRTDGVHCRESAGTGPVNLKVVPITSAALAGHHGPINGVSLSHTHYWYEVGMLKVPTKNNKKHVTAGVVQYSSTSNHATVNMCCRALNSDMPNFDVRGKPSAGLGKRYSIHCTACDRLAVDPCGLWWGVITDDVSISKVTQGGVLSSFPSFD